MWIEITSIDSDSIYIRPEFVNAVLPRRKLKHPPRPFISPKEEGATIVMINGEKYETRESVVDVKARIEEHMRGVP